MRAVSCGLVLAIVLGGIARPAPAQAPSRESEYARTIGEALNEVAAEHWQEARALFEHAHALFPSARTLRGLGICAFELRHYAQALSELEASLADTRRPLTATQRTEVQEALARTRRYVGQVSVRLEPADARLRLDGVAIEKRELILDVGDYRLSASAPGYRDTERALRVAGGQTQTIALQLIPVELAVASDPAARRQPDGAAVAGTAQRDDPPGLAERWWFWTAVGAVVAGGAIAAIVLTSDDPAPERGVGGRIQLVRIAP
jgi:hypothetical protein